MMYHDVSDAIFSAVWKGKTIGVNDWHDATTKTVTLPGGMKRRQARIYQSPVYHRFKENMAVSLRSQANSGGFSQTIDTYVDLVVGAWLWKMKDTDGIDKPIGDALEDAGIIANDRLIRHHFIYRHYHRKSEEDMLLIALFPIPQEELDVIKAQQEEGYGAIVSDG